MRYKSALIMAIVIGFSIGCAGIPMNPYADPVLMHGNSRQVTYKGASFPDTMTKAQKMADEYAKQYGKVAVLRQDGGYQLIYDLVYP
jgi:ABC-type phosphate transport system substrate-binding protein